MCPTRALFLSTWLAGGVLAFCGAMAYAELAALRPRAGGEYVYLREAYGSLAGLPDRLDVVRRRLCRRHGRQRRWSSRSISSGSFPARRARRRWLQIPLPYLPITFSNQTIIAIAAVWLFAFVHIRGVGPGTLRRATC